jgi:hypothetical protein
MRQEMDRRGRYEMERMMKARSHFAEVELRGARRLRRISQVLEALAIAF